MSSGRPGFFNVTPGQAALGTVVQVAGPAVGAVIGALRTIGGTSAEIACNAKCDGFYGALASLTLNVALLALKHGFELANQNRYVVLESIERIESDSEQETSTYTGQSNRL